VRNDPDCTNEGFAGLKAEASKERGVGITSFLMEVGRTTHMSTPYTIQYPQRVTPLSDIAIFENCKKFFGAI
jgi:hypothetical protein